MLHPAEHHSPWAACYISGLD